MTEKRILALARKHPYLTQLYCCFQTKVCLRGSWWTAIWGLCWRILVFWLSDKIKKINHRSPTFFSQGPCKIEWILPLKRSGNIWTAFSFLRVRDFPLKAILVKGWEGDRSLYECSWTKKVKWITLVFASWRKQQTWFILALLLTFCHLANHLSLLLPSDQMKIQ